MDWSPPAKKRKQTRKDTESSKGTSVKGKFFGYVAGKGGEPNKPGSCGLQAEINFIVCHNSKNQIPLFHSKKSPPEPQASNCINFAQIHQREEMQEHTMKTHTLDKRKKSTHDR